MFNLISLSTKSPSHKLSAALLARIMAFFGSLLEMDKKQIRLNLFETLILTVH